MAKKGGAESGNKAARQAQKAAAQEEKVRRVEEQLEAEEAEKWEKGAKKQTAKREEQASKKADALRKKQERDALLAEEESSTPGRARPKNNKTATKKTRGLDLAQLDEDGSSGSGGGGGGGGAKGKALPALSATGIDNALDALSLDHSSGTKIDKHPERRYPAAYKKYEDRRLQEMEDDGTGDGLRLNQKKEKIKKEFDRHPDNPFNQLTAQFNATKEDLQKIRKDNAAGIEKRLAGS